MKLLSKDMLKSVSFNSLNFIEPFSQVMTGLNQYTEQSVLLNGVGNKPGVLVVKYIDCIGVTRYRFKSIEYCLGNAARRVYQLLAEKNVQNVEFAVIPTVKKYHARILSSLKEDYYRIPIDNHFEILKPWLQEKRTDKPPIESLLFRRPFIEFNNFKRFSFYDYKDRPGMYLFREKLLTEGTIRDVYVGETSGVMPSRIRDKFYQNKHLYYKEIPGVREYYISAIEIRKDMLPKGSNFNKTLIRYQDVLTNLLDARDNKMGKVLLSSELEEPLEGYKPIDTEVEF